LLQFSFKILMIRLL